MAADFVYILEASNSWRSLGLSRSLQGQLYLSHSFVRNLFQFTLFLVLQVVHLALLKFDETDLHYCHWLTLLTQW